jgi:AcrR family transcriptional regulator
MFGNVMAKNENTKSTKELILDAAFSFLEMPRFDSFSMNELAAKVGVSKPAIYRHFTNKEAVLEAMENRIVENLAFFLKEIGSQDKVLAQKSLANLVDYFVANPSHINYLIAQISSTPNYEELLFEKLYERDVSFVREGDKNVYIENFRSDMNRFSQHVFCGMSVFFFVKAQEQFFKMGHIPKFSENFGEKVVNLLFGGLASSTEPGDAFHPEPISDSRKKELLNLCKIPHETFPEENRIFTALASVIEKYKIPGVTVERIAAELNMAKSSLYEYFENKNQMVKCLINKELQLLQTIIIENSAEAKNFTEYVYILMASEMEYFSHRPSIIPICGWLLMGGEEISEQNRAACEDEGEISPWEKRLPDVVASPDLGFPYPSEVITGWIRCLPVAFLVEAKGKNLSEEKCMEGFMLMIDCILNGVGGNK